MDLYKVRKDYLLLYLILTLGISPPQSLATAGLGLKSEYTAGRAIIVDFLSNWVVAEGLFLHRAEWIR